MVATGKHIADPAVEVGQSLGEQQAAGRRGAPDRDSGEGHRAGRPGPVGEPSRLLLLVRGQDGGREGAGPLDAVQ